MTRAKRKAGDRLADPRDPIVRDALTRACPECKVEPKQWCIGVGAGLGLVTKGRRLTRLHFARCRFRSDSSMSNDDGD